MTNAVRGIITYRFFKYFEYSLKVFKHFKYFAGVTHDVKKKNYILLKIVNIQYVNFTSIKGDEGRAAGLDPKK